MNRSVVLWSGMVGLLASVLTGAGEFLLHFDALARFEPQYAFFTGISHQQSTLGHFIGVLGAPMYLVGCWHIQLMLRPANPRWSMIAFIVAAYGFVVGAVWIGSRASISALINMPDSAEMIHLVELYNLRYETLLQIIRITVLVLSAIYVWLTLSGRSHYPKWMAALNPIVLIVGSFLIYAIAPVIGIYLMPIALNVAFFVFFSASILIANNKEF